ncbi:MAG: hypothetical protein LBI28_00910 [Treponema sp.]|jgi:hypothetical protein|nr:hypothetical protein [Treponema sp.]
MSKERCLRRKIDKIGTMGYNYSMAIQVELPENVGNKRYDKCKVNAG